MTKRWFTRQEAAKYLSIHPRTLDRWVEAGMVTRYHVGELRSVRFEVSDLDAMHKPEPSVAG